MANAANPQLAQTREAMRRMQDDFNAFRAASDRNFTNLRESLFDDNNRQHGAVGERLQAFQQQFTALNQRMTEFEDNLTALQGQMRNSNERLNERLITITQNTNPLSGRLDALAQQTNQSRLQLTAIDERITNLSGRTELVANNHQTALQGQIDGVVTRLTAIDGRLADSVHLADIEVLLAPLLQRFDGTDPHLSLRDLRSELDERLALLRQQIEVGMGRREEEFGRQVGDFTVELRAGRRERHRHPKVVKVFCVIL